MPLATIHLFSLSSCSELSPLLRFIQASPVQPLVLSKPIRWIIKPEHIDVDSLLSPQWDLLLIMEDTKPSQDLITSIISPSYDTLSSAKFSIQHHYHFTTGIPSRLTKDFTTKTNPALLHPKNQSAIPSLTGALNNPIVESSSQTLALSPELQSWIGTSPSASSSPVHGAVSMLNLLSFRAGMKESYLKYGAAFGKSIGSKRGGNAKLVGNIVQPHDSSTAEKSKSESEEGMIWHEFALAHYPTIVHFADMLASEDYQSVNREFRVPALADTCILCTSELEIEKILGNAGRAKL